VARTLLVRGMLVGLAAGLLAFVVGTLLGEHSLSAGIRFETARAAAAGEAPAAEMYSRTVQSTVGLASASLIFGVALGGIFALAYGVVQGRLGRLGVRATALTVAVGGFLALYLLPALKYPANPPGASDSTTIGHRTDLYFLILAASVLIVVGTVITARQLAPRFGAWNGALLALLGGVVALGVMYAGLPGVDETPVGFSAGVLWRFRIASAAIQLTTWTTLGLLFGAWTERAMRTSSTADPGRAREAAQVPAGG